MAEMNCSCCRFFHVGFGDRIGVCRRFPSFQNRSMNEWCGEYSPPMIALPVIDPPQTDAKIEVVLPENTATVEVKRRGRPKKEDGNV
mgnify:FL=1